MDEPASLITTLDCKRGLPDYITHAQVVHNWNEIQMITYWTNDVRIGHLIYVYGQPDFAKWRPYIYLRWLIDGMTIRAYSNESGRDYRASVRTVHLGPGIY